MTNPPAGWNQNPGQPGGPPPGTYLPPGSQPPQPGAYPPQAGSPQPGGMPPAPVPHQAGAPFPAGNTPGNPGAYPGGPAPGGYPGPSHPPTATPPKPKRTAAIVVGVVAVVVIAAIIVAAVLIPRLTQQTQIDPYQVDEIFDPPLLGVQNAPGSETEQAPDYFKTSSTDTCAIRITAVLTEAVTVHELESIDGTEFEAGWAVTWDTTAEAQRGYNNLKTMMTNCRPGNAVTESGGSRDRYTLISGGFSADSPYTAITLMQYGNVAVFTVKNGNREMQQWSKAIATRMDEIG